MGLHDIARSLLFIPENSPKFNAAYKQFNGNFKPKLYPSRRCIKKLKSDFFVSTKIIFSYAMKIYAISLTVCFLVTSALFQSRNNKQFVVLAITFFFGNNE